MIQRIIADTSLISYSNYGGLACSSFLKYVNCVCFRFKLNLMFIDPYQLRILKT